MSVRATRETIGQLAFGDPPDDFFCGTRPSIEAEEKDQARTNRGDIGSKGMGGSQAT
jgi:hypothetical protein